MTIAERARTARTKRGLKQREVAVRSGLSNGYVSMVETSGAEDSHIQQPSLGNLQKLATALDVPVEWLVFGTGPEPTWPAEPPPVGEQKEPAA